MRTRRSAKNQQRLWQSLAGDNVPAPRPEAKPIEYTPIPEEEERRLFIGAFPTGLVYCDTKRQEHGDYQKIAYLNYRTLELEWYDKRSALLEQIMAHASGIQQRRGEQYQVSTSGQYVILGQ